MAWKSLYLGESLVHVASLPFYSGWEGGENIPDGPCLVAANHSSFLDGPILSYTYSREKQTPLHMIAYAEPFSHWLMGWFLRSAGCIPFLRNDAGSRRRMLLTALGWLKAGEAVGIFPEGHINQRQRLNFPRPGLALLALESGVPIAPAAILGSAESFPLGRRFPRVGRRMKIVFGEPIRLSPEERGYAAAGGEERRELVRGLSARVMLALSAMTGRERRHAGK